MTARRHANLRPGVGLLLVLATLVLAVSAAVALTRAAGAARLHADTAAADVVADRLLRAAEPPILDWLHRHAGNVVLPIEAESPRVQVADDAVEIAGQPCRLTITAFDQCGMVSATARFAPVDATLPPRALEALERAGRPFVEHPGLDLLGLAAGGEPVFPSGGDGHEAAPGELLATHNPPRGGGTPVLNVNTAPMPLVAAVYAARGLGLEAVMDARAAGRALSPGATAAPAASAPGEAPLPVSVSAAWAFRVDCRAGPRVRSWWWVFESTGSNWERVQRLAIDE